MVDNDRGGLRRRAGRGARITPRERQLLVEILAGQSNRAIAKKYGVAEQTVRNQLSVLYEKVGVSTRLELAIVAMREKLLDK